MAGREGRYLRDMQANAMAPDSLDAEMNRVFILGPECEAKLEHVIGTNKWIPSALVGEDRVAIEFVMDEVEIEASITVNEGLRDFLGIADMEIANGYVFNPHGPVEHETLNHLGTPLNITIHRVGHSIAPFLTIEIKDDDDIRELFEAVFGIGSLDDLIYDTDSD